jgi:serine/threonine protein phosphatase PrpC
MNPQLFAKFCSGDTPKASLSVCEDLLKDALADGGTDNITLIVGRALPSGER